ncbi:MAG: right-handed parallel beta-helix repeat-containing protein, partial [Planctomycetes bacterium]|nr:right-handed parallel beta-helix repeat-containing protein [Planctomycetota bacterium]
MRHITRHGTCALLALGALAVILPGAATAVADDFKRRYVDFAVQGGNHDGTSWADAYDTLQEALTEAGVDEIWVAEGTYKPHASDRTVAFDLPDGIEVYGGFIGTETARNQRDPVENETILSGDIDTSGTLDSFHVVTADTRVAALVLDGFTITKGNADGGTGEVTGGGMFIRNCVNVTIKDCIFVDNFANLQGGAIRVLLSLFGAPSGGSDLTIDGCEFNNNETGDYGGAIFYWKQGPTGDHDLTISNSSFDGNKVTDDNFPGHGGAIVVEGADDTVITNTDFTNNFAVDNGGALALFSKHLAAG